MRRISMKAAVVAVCALLATACSAAPGGSDAEKAESPRDLVARETYGCGGEYPASALERPRGAENGSHPANRELRQLLRTDDDFADLPHEGWRRVQLTRSSAVFVVDSWPGHRFPYQDIVLEKIKGRWRWAGSGDCRPSATGEEGSAAIWHLRDDGQSVDDDDAHLDLMLQEMACASGRTPPDEGIHPEVIYGEQYIVIIIRIEPVEGFANCIGNPRTPYTLHLDEPVDDRKLIDGGHYPPNFAAEAPL